MRWETLVNEKIKGLKLRKTRSLADIENFLIFWLVCENVIKMRWIEHKYIP